MKKVSTIMLCGLLIAALASPVLADGQPKKRTDSSITSRICSGGYLVADKTAGLFTGCLKRTFSLFNPCLDAVKACTNLVMTPVGKPFDYLEQTIDKNWPGKKMTKAKALSVGKP